MKRGGDGRRRRGESMRAHARSIPPDLSTSIAPNPAPHRPCPRSRSATGRRVCNPGKKHRADGGPDNAVRTRSGASIVSNEYSPQMLRLRLACLRAGVARDIAQKASERDALLPAAARPMKAGLAALEPAVARTGAATDTVAMAMVDISERLLRLTSEAVTSLTDCDGAQRCGAGRRRCFGVDWTLRRVRVQDGDVGRKTGGWA